MSVKKFGKISGKLFAIMTRGGNLLPAYKKENTPDWFRVPGVYFRYDDALKDANNYKKMSKTRVKIVIVDIEYKWDVK